MEVPQNIKGKAANIDGATQNCLSISLNLVWKKMEREKKERRKVGKKREI